MTRMNAAPRRVARVGKRRAVRIIFRLNAPARVIFLVRGPAPSCDVVGRFSVRGRRGTNRVRFSGHVGRKALRPGTYRITARPANHPRRAHRVTVIVGSGPREELICSHAARYGFLGTAAYFGDGGSDESFLASEGGEPAAATRRADQQESDRSHGVLPAITRKVRQLPNALPSIPKPSAPREPASPPMLLGIAAIALLVLSGIALSTYVIRFFRGADTTSA
jgi:hypothetical protein